jgi:hypothetical protein
MMAAISVCFLGPIEENAAAWTMDLSPAGILGVSAGGTSAIVQIDDLLNITNAGLAPIEVSQSLGDDGILNDDDTFRESGFMQVIGFDGQAIFFQQSAGGPAFLYASFTELQGKISNYNNGGDGDTTISNYPSKIANDTFDLIFDPTFGTIEFLADADLDPTNGYLSKLADLDLIAGSGIAPELSAGAVFNGTVDFRLAFKSVLNGVFSFEPDLSGVISFADVNAGVIGLGDDGNDLIFDIENSGTFRVIPIPSSLLLLVSGLVGLAGFRGKFKKS